MKNKILAGILIAVALFAIFLAFQNPMNSWSNAYHTFLSRI